MTAAVFPARPGSAPQAPRTVWRSAQRWRGEAPARAVGRPHVDHETLLRLLRTSLARGHWRVAVRRFLMLQAAASPVPAAERQQCEALQARLEATERARMNRQALQWARMVRGGDPG